MTYESVEQVLERLKRGFQEKWEENPDFRRKLKGKDRDILIDLGPDGAYHLVVRNGYLERIDEGRPSDPHVRVQMGREDLLAIFNKEVHPVKAYTTGRVKVKAPFRDLLLVRAFLGG